MFPSISLPPLGFSSTTRSGEGGQTAGATNTGGLTFGNKSANEGVQTLLIYGAVAVAAFLVLRMVVKGRR